MLVTVFCAPRDRPESTFALEVSPELELRDFVALCELESGIPAGEIQITYVEQPLKDPTRALGNYGVKDGDVVVLRQADKRPPPTQPAFPGLPHIDFRSISVPGTSTSNSQRNAVRPPQPQPTPTSPPQRSAQPSSPSAFHGSSPQGLDDPALLQQMLLSNPHELSLLKERNPPLAEALLSGDLERFTKVLLEQQQDRAKREQERIRLLTADPFDLEAQAKIEEDIRQHNVEENMTIAMEEAPESFGQVVMLYINCKVNGHPVKAFVDSGAQMTIMSQACAERCNIMRLVDRRWAGIAKGVGTQKIIGRVHLAQVQIEGDFLPCSFSILEDQPMDMLLGLDMLKRHQCSIDLKKNVLLIGTTGTETRFLAEAELPECARLAYGAEGREDARPEELADRELAEALQRSIQESDTADGQTTSPLLPTPLTLPKTLDQRSSTSSGQSQSQTLDHSSLASADTVSATSQGQDLPGLLEPPEPDDVGPPLQGHPTPLSDQSDSSVPPVTTSPTDVPSTCAHPEDMSTGRSVEEEVQTGTTETEDGLEGADSTTNLQLEQLSPVQPMEQESDVPELGTLNQPDSLEMESSSVCDTTVSSEREEPEVERRTRSDSIPSLAAALKELHELIVSNKGTQNRSASCSPPHPFRQEENEKCSLGNQPEPSTAITQPTNAKANHAAAMSNEGPSQCVLPELSGQEEHLDVNPVETLEEQRPKPCPDDSEERKTDGCGQHVASNSSICQSDPEISPDSAGDLELRELSEEQQGRRAEGEGASSNNSPKTVSPMSVEVGSAEDTSAPACAPQLVVGQYPAEHIQRIQAAGFSAQEAAEALEQAHGVVELALLALLARSITVPS